jgi:hypothetical protein
MIVIFTGMTPTSRRIKAFNRLPLAASLALVAILGCHRTTSAPLMPAGVRFVPRAAWGAHAPVLPMRAHVPNRLTIHHTATVQNPARTIEAKLIGLQAVSQRDDSLASGKKKPAWADVPYHYYVAVDGAVAEGREWRYAGDTNTEYNPTGHLLVVVEGNFETDTLTSAQHRTLDALIPTLARHFGIAGSMLGAHRDFANTQCPGRNLYAEIPRLRALITDGRQP